MLENYMNLNGIWTPVLIVPENTVVSNNIIFNGNIQYNVEFLNKNQYIIKSKTIFSIPDNVKNQITELAFANTELGKQVSTLVLSNTQKDEQIKILGQQVTALILKGGVK